MATLALSPAGATNPTATLAFKSAENVEDQLRHVTQIKRIRVSEFFKDFDPLRSGYITKTQFRRCLDQHLGLRISEEDYKFLVDKYDVKGNGMVNYRNFSETLEKVFDPDQLGIQPSAQVEAFQKSAQPSQNSFSEDTVKLIAGILSKCHDYYKYHGISVKSCYTDFDRHHRGFVTASQFHRSFPGPAEVTPAEITALAQYYYDPATGLHNYLQFHYDIVSLDREEGLAKESVLLDTNVKKPLVASLDEIFQRIRDVIYKNGIRTTEFFRDHDKLRSGVITENQFICGLMVCCGSVAHLTREEIQRIVDYYRSPDGRVKYKEFCHLMENSYNVPDLEKKPTATVSRPLRGHLSRPLNALGSQEHEKKLEEVLERLKTQVMTRRLMLYPYFRDFDRGKGYTRGVTKPQFERLLHFQSLQVTPQELELIVTKFQYPNGGDVNYVAFIQAIDEEYTGQAMEQETPSKPSDSPSTGGEGSTTLTHSHSSTKHPSQPPTAQEPVSLEQLVKRLQEHVLCNRIRVLEHFQDFDPLRSGSISAAKFRQGLSSMGQSYLNDEQFSLLCQQYSDPKRKDYICWKKFLQDVDQVFFQPSGTLNLPRPGTINFDNRVSDEEKQTLDEVMFTLSEKVKQRRILAKPCFEDFDRHNMGYVTCNQFHQCLSYLGLSISPAHMRLVEMRFADQKGFNYLKFLDQLQPSEKLENKYQTRMTQLMSKQDQVSNRGVPQTSINAEEVLIKVKTKVCKERIRVLEFMRDYDKLRSGRIPQTSFRRALDLCGFELTPAEVVALEKRYLSSKDPSYVDYTAFSDEVESIFTTKHLEKTPTADVVQFVPNSQVDCNFLSPEEEQILQKTLHRLAERVRVRRIQIFPLFEDYDRVHIGSVTRTQFHRVLSELELGGLVNALEFVLLYRKFDVKVGGRNDVNYYAFCEMIDDYAQTKWSDPALK